MLPIHVLRAFLATLVTRPIKKRAFLTPSLVPPILAKGRLILSATGTASVIENVLIGTC